MKLIIKIFLWTFITVLTLAIAFVVTLTALEYRPDDIESVSVYNNQANEVELNQSIRLMTFNLGYAGLGADEDFVMDGGKKGRPDSKEDVLYYLNGIYERLTDQQIDIYLLQEVDYKARRSYHINQVEGIHEQLGSSYSSQFALNFKAPFVPFPVSLTDYIGYVESGIQTLMTYQVNSSYRYQFPGAFSWPLRVANLKRAMLVYYLDIKDSDSQLVIVNLHMSAYDATGDLRAQEMAFLKTFMMDEYQKGNYVIVGGDFNQTFPGAIGAYEVDEGLYQAFPIEEDYLPNGFQFFYDASSPTCRLLNQPYVRGSEHTFYYVIDGFIISDNITVLPFEGLNDQASAVTIDDMFLYSDHNAVVIELMLND